MDRLLDTSAVGLGSVGGLEAVVDRPASVQIVGKEDVAERKMGGLTVAAPGRELAPDVAQLPDGHPATGHDVNGRYRPSDLGERHREDVGLHLGQDSIAVGRDHDQAGRQGRRSALEDIDQVKIRGLDR